MLSAEICISDKELNYNFLKENYGLRKDQPFILALERAAFGIQAGFAGLSGTQRGTEGVRSYPELPSLEARRE